MRVWPIFLLLLGAMTGSAAQQPADDALIGIYGALPRIRSVAISPNGAHVAFIQRVEGHDTFVVIDQRSGEVIGAANASEVKARSVYFATPNHVILIASRTLSHVRIRGDWEHHNAVVYDIRTGDLTRLPRKQMNLFVGQSGLGRLIGVDSENARVYLPAFFEAGREPSNHLMEIDLDDGDARIHEEGNAHTVDWFVGRGGRVLAREDFDNKKHLHIVYSYASGEPVELYRSETEIPDLRIEGVSDDESALVVVAKVGAADAVHRISLADGSWSEPAHVQSDGEIDSVVTFPPERFAHGIRVSGPLPSYLLFDEVDNRIMAGLQQTFPTSTVTPVSSTPDMTQIVLLVSGNEGAQRYLLYDRTAHRLDAVAESYPEIEEGQIGPISAINYASRDGTKIPAILTWPLGVDTTEARRDLPLLVLPHGGPESYDSIRFDWWAQYFARKGYLILQPNFRGSTGFGSAHRQAGRGQWGKLMQDDLADGVQTLTAAGYADPDRVCIMGASYGGYAALAGGAFDAELYRCIIAVAGVSDLPRMLSDERRYSGSDHWVVAYWEKLVGDSKEDKARLLEVSPVEHAEAYRAPVLLLHGDQDTVVPIVQSSRMARALRRANRRVEFVELDGEDHWLSQSETRIAMLREISAFLARNNPVRAEASGSAR